MPTTSHLLLPGALFSSGKGLPQDVLQVQVVLASTAGQAFSQDALDAHADFKNLRALGYDILLIPLIAAGPRADTS